MLLVEDVVEVKVELVCELPNWVVVWAVEEGLEVSWTIEDDSEVDESVWDDIVDVEREEVVNSVEENKDESEEDDRNEEEEARNEDDSVDEINEVIE